MTRTKLDKLKSEKGYYNMKEDTEKNVSIALPPTNFLTAFQVSVMGPDKTEVSFTSWLRLSKSCDE